MLDANAMEMKNRMCVYRQLITPSPLPDNVTPVGTFLSQCTRTLIVTRFFETSDN